jgi:hypothetical protein
VGQPKAGRKPNKALQPTAATVFGLPGLEVSEVAAAAELRRSAVEEFAVGWLPETDVTAVQPELIARLLERCTRPGYTAFAAMRRSRQVGKEVLQSTFFAPEQFLVYHERHDCPRLNRLHIVPREELVALLDNRIRPERGEGVDFTIATFEMTEFLITNHDGELWLRTPSLWPASE